MLFPDSPLTADKYLKKKKKPKYKSQKCTKFDTSLVFSRAPTSASHACVCTASSNGRSTRFRRVQWQNTWPQREEVKFGCFSCGVQLHDIVVHELDITSRALLFYGKQSDYVPSSADVSCMCVLWGSNMWRTVRTYYAQSPILEANDICSLWSDGVLTVGAISAKPLMEKLERILPFLSLLRTPLTNCLF